MQNGTKKTARIAEVLNVREYAKTATFYLKLRMDNGDVGEIGKKKRDALQPGDELTYTVEAGRYGDNLKEVRENASSGPQRGNARGSTAAFALSYAKDLAVANIAASGKMIPMDDALANKITHVAGVFHGWLKANE